MKKWMKLTAGLATASTLAACSGGGGDSSSPSTGVTTKSLAVSGVLSGLSVASHKPFGLDVGVGTFAVNTVRCVPGSGPNVAGEGTIGLDGSFRLTISGMQEGASLGCWVFVDGVPSIPLAFANGTSFDGVTSKQRFGYSPKVNATSLELGTVTVSTLGGVSVAVVNPNSIVDNGTAAASTFADMTGNWVVSVVEDSAANYMHPCDLESELTTTQLAACKAEWSNQVFFINNFSASKTGELDRRGFSLWASQAHFNSCGQKEGISIDPSWTVAGTYSAGVKEALPAAAFNASEPITDAMLTKAPFQKWVDPTDSSRDNCIGSTTCATATNCLELMGGIDTAASPGAKLSCILSSMNSGGMTGYQWGEGVCYRRADVNWNSMYPQPPATGPVSEVTGLCSDANCGGAIQWENDPTFRHFASELFVNGNLGSASATEFETGEAGGKTCDLARTHTFTITQNSATTATMVVEFATRPKTGGAWDPACEASTTWWAKEMEVARIKVNLTKQ